MPTPRLSLAKSALPTKDDGILRTVADAADYMMALSKDSSAHTGNERRD